MMRARTVLKESSAPSLCAFCAHRLGQVSRPSHVQRRFLQSTRPTSKPPAEAAARRDDDGEGSSQASWGALAGNGNASSWGVGGGLASSGIPSRPTQSHIPSRSSIPSTGIPARAPAPSSSIQSRPQAQITSQVPLGDAGLLPHEIKARKMMRERQRAAAEAAQAHVATQDKMLGTNRTPIRGFQKSRGSIIDFGGARNQNNRDNSRLQPTILLNHQRERSLPSRTPAIRHVIKDYVGPVDGDTQQQEPNSWTQLRKREPEAQQPIPPPPPPQQQVSSRNDFADERTRREEDSKLGGYVPLSRNVRDSESRTFPRRDTPSTFTGVRTTRLRSPPIEGDDRGAVRSSRENAMLRQSQGWPPRQSTRDDRDNSGSAGIPRRDSYPQNSQGFPPRRNPRDDRDSRRAGSISRGEGYTPQSSNGFSARQGTRDSVNEWGTSGIPSRGNSVPPSSRNPFRIDDSRGSESSGIPSRPGSISRDFDYGNDRQTNRSDFADRRSSSPQTSGFPPPPPTQPAKDDGDEMVSFRATVAEKEPETPAQRREREGREEQEQREREAFEALEEERERREKKVRKKRSTEPTWEAGPKGKDKDKARRRSNFGRTAEDDAEEAAALARAELKKQRKKEKAAKKAAAPTPMLLPEYISISNLALALRVRINDFVEKLEELGFTETSHDFILNAENAGLIVQEYGFEAIIERSESEDLKAREPHADPLSLPPRPPVVTIMGHVDHGKTTILDYLRKSSVAAGEAGGITQHIGAFSVPMPGGKIITFLDTPGHAAFLAMRQRGANVTDIVILVVAADDSVKPQTIEAIKHAQNAKVPIIVAINKIDKEDADIERVKLDLSRNGVEIEDYGGDTQVVCVSGKTGQGMDELEEAAVTLSEILDMRAETDGLAEGWVLEASIKSMGKVATVLVRRGTMRPGDVIVAGTTWSRIRVLRNEAGVEVEEATPGQPVQIDGWREQPLAGDEVLQAPTESKAKSVVEYRLEKVERDKLAEDMEAINEYRKEADERQAIEKAQAEAIKAAKKAKEDLPTFEKIEKKATGPKEVFFIVKADVSGSVEAVVNSISALGNAEVQPHILRSGVGHISEFDIEHAAVAHGTILNFSMPLEPHIARLAEENKVKIIDHNIIYRLVDEVKAELSKELKPLVTQKVLGEAEVAKVFMINVKKREFRAVAGCKVRNGSIFRGARVRVLREGEKVFDGMLSSLQNVKKDVAEMKNGQECGMGFEDWGDIQVGDKVQCYELKEEKRFL